MNALRTSVFAIATGAATLLGLAPVQAADPSPVTMIDAFVSPAPVN